MAMTAPPTARLDPNDVAPLERLPEAPVGDEEEDELEAEAPLALGAGVIEAELEAEELADALAAKPLPIVDKVVQDDEAGAG